VGSWSPRRPRDRDGASGSGPAPREARQPRRGRRASRRRDGSGRTPRQDRGGPRARTPRARGVFPGAGRPTRAEGDRWWSRREDTIPPPRIHRQGADRIDARARHEARPRMGGRGTIPAGPANSPGEFARMLLIDVLARGVAGGVGVVFGFCPTRRTSIRSRSWDGEGALTLARFVVRSMHRRARDRDTPDLHADGRRRPSATRPARSPYTRSG
jgi:hypothetical protein